MGKSYLSSPLWQPNYPISLPKHPIPLFWHLFLILLWYFASFYFVFICFYTSLLLVCHLFLLTWVDFDSWFGLLYCLAMLVFYLDVVCAWLGWPVSLCTVYLSVSHVVSLSSPKRWWWYPTLTGCLYTTFADAKRGKLCMTIGVGSNLDSNRLSFSNFSFLALLSLSWSIWLVNMVI